MTDKRKAAYSFLRSALAVISFFSIHHQKGAEHSRAVSCCCWGLGRHRGSISGLGGTDRLHAPPGDWHYQRPDASLLVHDDAGYAMDSSRRAGAGPGARLGWAFACGLIVLERFGKAIRHPAKTTLVSFAANEVGARPRALRCSRCWTRSGAFSAPSCYSPSSQ